jgi:hypothetical protein
MGKAGMKYSFSLGAEHSGQKLAQSSYIHGLQPLETSLVISVISLTLDDHFSQRNQVER